MFTLARRVFLHVKNFWQCTQVLALSMMSTQMCLGVFCGFQLQKLFSMLSMNGCLPLGCGTCVFFAIQWEFLTALKAYASGCCQLVFHCGHNRRQVTHHHPLIAVNISSQKQQNVNQTTTPSVKIKVNHLPALDPFVCLTFQQDSFWLCNEKIWPWFIQDWDHSLTLVCKWAH